jgi:hypothetical protein
MAEGNGGAGGGLKSALQQIGKSRCRPANSNQFPGGIGQGSSFGVPQEPSDLVSARKRINRGSSSHRTRQEN